MGKQDDRLGSLLAFNDIALILSTYGVLLIYNYIFAPINTNTWIVCTFFVGIKILIVGIADITGIGRSYIVSLLFTVIADGLIVLINHLMAFAISIRLMLIMVIADLVCVFLAVFIWKKFREQRVPAGYGQTDWVYDNSQSGETQADHSTQIPNTQVTEHEAIEDQPVESIFDFQKLDKTIPAKDTDILSGFSNEPVTQGKDILKFDELTQELPAQDELQHALATQTEFTESPLDNTYQYFGGLDIFKNMTESMAEESREAAEPEVQEESIKEIPEEIVEEVEEKEEIQPVPLIEQSETIETPDQEEKVIQPAFLVNSPEEFTEITGSFIEFTHDFAEIPIDLDQTMIDSLRDEVKDEYIHLNKSFRKLADAYNLSVNKDERISEVSEIADDLQVKAAKKVLYDNYKKILSKDFIADDVIDSITDLISKLSKRSYSIDYAEENLQERLAKEKEAEARKQREREALKKKEEEARLNQQKQKETTEVLLQQNNMDIIVDSADIELLKEYLAQQESLS